MGRSDKRNHIGLVPPDELNFISRLELGMP